MKNKFKTKIGIIVVIFLSLAPVFLWLLSAPINLRFNGFTAVLTSIGQLSGLIGLALFAINLILAARLKFIENYFNGLNRIYVSHHLIGGIALILLLIHPLSLAVSYIPASVHFAALFLLPSLENIPKTYGSISLALMIVLLFITFFLRWRYHIWKISHKFLGLAFLFASLHIYFIPSDVSRYYPLRFYMLGLVSLGIVAAVYKIIFGGNKGLAYRVKNVYNPRSWLVEIELEPLNKSLKFFPGQFAFVSFADKKIGKESHPFSITSSPQEKFVRFSVKALGDYTSNLKNLKAGTAVRLEGPYGTFCFRNFPIKQIWIAGGIGVAPFLGMARSLIDSDRKYKIDFYYCTNNEEEAVYLKEFKDISSRFDNIKINTVFSSEGGKITAKMVEKELSNLLSEEHVLLCGPPLMMKSLESQFKERGVPSGNIHSEEFLLY